MQIKYKIFSVILLIISLLAFSWGYHIYEDVNYSERYAFKDAESIATVLALSIMREEEVTKVPAMYKKTVRASGLYRRPPQDSNGVD